METEQKMPQCWAFQPNQIKWWATYWSLRIFSAFEQFLVTDSTKHYSSSLFRSLSILDFWKRIFNIWSIKCRLITKLITDLDVNYETNLMSLINPSLDYIYCSNLVPNHVLIRPIRFVSRFTVHLCNAIYFLTTFSTPYKLFKFFLYFGFMDLNRAW